MGLFLSTNCLILSILKKVCRRHQILSSLFEFLFFFLFWTRIAIDSMLSFSNFDPFSFSGYIVSANHRVVNYHKYPYWLGNIFLNGYRAARIASLLDQRISSGQPITQEVCIFILICFFNLFASTFFDSLLKVYTITLLSHFLFVFAIVF